MKNGESVLIRSVAPESQYFIDVGANRGSWSEFFLKHAPSDAFGLLCEPASSALALLRKRFGTVSRVELIEAALGDRIGEADFYEDDNAGEASSLISNFSKMGAKKTMIKLTTVDQEMQRRSWSKCDVLKIDAEGYDLHVIRGASKCLKMNVIGLVQFEYNSPWALAGSTLASAISLFEGFGYQVFLLKSSGLHELDYARYGEYFRYSNYVAVSPSWMPRIRDLICGRI